MKTFSQQVLVLGGFYFIISFLSSLGSGNIFEIFDLIMFITFIFLLITLCCKKRYNFLINFQNQFAKTSYYLSGLGIVQYFEIIFITFPGIAYGYQASMAQYNGSETPTIPLTYLQIMRYAYWGILIFSLSLITYLIFRKRKTDKRS